MAKIKLKKSEKRKDRVSVSKQQDVRPSDAPSEIDGYKVVKLKCSADSKASHHVLVKEHSVREKCEGKPSERTIFVRSVPPFVTEEDLKHAFGTFGPVQTIYFHHAPCASLPPVNASKFFTDVPPIRGFKVAYVVYENEESAQSMLLASPETPLLLYPDGRPTTTLLDRLVEQYNKTMTTDPTALKKDVDEVMQRYDETLKSKEADEKRERERQEAEDGWITVTKKKGIPRKESVHDKIKKKQDRRTKKTQLVNFYRFQIRESKMNQLVKLKEKFEEDKKRIAQLKESRKFKPF